MHTLGPTTPGRFRRSRGRAAALVAGCSIAVAAAAALPAFAGGSAPGPKGGPDAVAIGCAFAGGENVMVPQSGPAAPLPKGATPVPVEELQGIAVEVVGTEGGEPPVPAKAVRVGTAVAGAGGVNGAPDTTDGAEPIAMEVITVDADDLPDCGAAAK